MINLLTWSWAWQAWFWHFWYSFFTLVPPPGQAWCFLQLGFLDLKKSKVVVIVHQCFAEISTRMQTTRLVLEFWSSLRVYGSFQGISQPHSLYLTLTRRPSFSCLLGICISPSYQLRYKQDNFKQWNKLTEVLWQSVEEQVVFETFNPRSIL